MIAASHNVPVLLRRRWVCAAGGDSVRHTDPESDVQPAAPGGGGAGLSPAGAAAGQECGR
jgi:hypothetical protein